MILIKVEPFHTKKKKRKRENYGIKLCKYKKKWGLPNKPWKVNKGMTNEKTMMKEGKV